MLTVERLRELLRYDPSTGVFTWNKSVAQKIKIGDRAGRVTTGGRGGTYLRIKIASREHYAHRLAWLYVHGEWPPVGMQIDHINGDSLDNRIANLRPATSSQNQANRRTQRQNTSGIKGVGWSKVDRKWRVRVTTNGWDRYVGVYDRIEDAAAAYSVAAQKYFGEFAKPDRKESPNV